MFQQTRVHVFQRRQQRCTIRRAGQDHHHHAPAEYPDHHFAHARLGNIPQLRNLNGVDHRKRNNSRGVACQLKRVGHVVGKVRAGPGA
ncbi:hypothetical protein D3C73_1159060 [compost metagenome]